MTTESPVPNNRPVISDVYFMSQMLPADALMKMTGRYDLASHIAHVGELTVVPAKILDARCVVTSTRAETEHDAFG